MKKYIRTILSIVIIVSMVFTSPLIARKVNAETVNSNVTQNSKIQIEMQDGSKMVFELYPELAPETVKNFLMLVKSHFYDGLKFHRIIKGFMIQGGDPEGDGTGGSDKSIKGEFLQNGYSQNNLKHTKGVISMARSADPDSATSQFFIMDGNASWLDGQYAAFGKLIDGEKTLDKITNTPILMNPNTGEMSLPKVDVIIKKVTILQSNLIEEKPEYKVFIDGKITKFNTPAISVNEKFMLPINEMLNNIGISKNKVVWNQKNGSYKIIDGKNTIDIKIGEKVVLVNGKSVKLDTETIFYKNIPYISINSMTLFERVVYWDKNTDSYLINKQVTFNKVKQIIDLMDKKMVSIKKFKAYMNNYDYTNFDNQIESITEKIIIQKDDIKKISYFLTEGSRGKLERYIYNGYVYDRQSSEKLWVKFEHNNMMTDISNFYGLSALYEKNNIFYAGLTTTEDKQKNEIKLQGSSYNTEYIFFIIEGGIKELSLTDFSYEIIIDKSTYMLKNIKFSVKGRNKSNDFLFNFDKKIEIRISDVNGNFKLNLPNETKDAKLLKG